MKENASFHMGEMNWTLSQKSSWTNSTRQDHAKNSSRILYVSMDNDANTTIILAPKKS